MARTAYFEAIGGPEVIQWHDVTLPPPGPGEVRLRQTAVGLNYIDTYHRSGLYPARLPSALGLEAAGVVDAVGDGVTGWVPGDRAGTFGPALGAYADERTVAADQLVHLPDGINDQTAAAIMLKGGTAAFLVEECAKVQAGQWVLVFAAAGGTGHLLVGWLHAIGAHVIGVVGSAAKEAGVLAAGAEHVLRHDRDDISARVRELTDGAGVPVIFDGVGAATWGVSLASAARRGLIVSFGNASGAVTGVDLGVLARHGSLFVTRPTMFDYAVGPQARQALVDRVFAMVARGAIRPDIGQRFALADAAEAHRALEAGETKGSSVLLP